MKPIDVPPPPGPTTQETSFTSSLTSSNLTQLPRSPLRPREATGNYGTLPPPQPSQQSSSKPPSTRALAPDLLRGLLMLLMALDHNAMALHSWPHGTAVNGEYDSVPVKEWNRPVALTIRAITHICAPGFTFLLGMGIAYFGRSRTNLNWTNFQMIRHFVARAVVLTLITVAMGLAMTMGQIWFMNIVLFALAVDYLLAGLLWMGIARLEIRVAQLLLRVLRKKPDDDEDAGPLLWEREMRGGPSNRLIVRAGDVAWHLVNAGLVVLATVTIWWNVWCSPTGGHCDVEPKFQLPESAWLKIWFWQVQGERVISGFPPMAWISFAVLGLLYGRIVLAKSWSPRAINFGNFMAGVLFTFVFVLTRLCHFGNLSEGCLQMPEHVANPDENPYLANPASFFYLIKYPPDVAYWAFAMAGNFFLLAFFGLLPTRFATKAFHVMLVFGTSALFFYVTHIILLFALGAGWIALIGHKLTTADPFTGQPGVGVDQVWAFFMNWALAIAILYPLCRWYGEFKKTKGVDSIWRFF